MAYGKTEVKGTNLSHQLLQFQTAEMEDNEHFWIAYNQCRSSDRLPQQTHFQLNSILEAVTYFLLNGNTPSETETRESAFLPPSLPPHQPPSATSKD